MGEKIEMGIINQDIITRENLRFIEATLTTKPGSHSKDDSEFGNRFLTGERGLEFL